MFELISRDKVLVSRKNPNDDCKRITVIGELARIDGRLIGRTRTQDGDLMIWRYGGFDEATGQAALVNPAFRPATFFDAKRQSILRDTGLHVMGPPADDVEFSAFAREYPAVARKLGIRPSTEDPGLFPVGRVELPKLNCPAPDGPDGWRHYLALARSGDFGLFGRHNPTPLTEQESFTVGELPVARANDASIAWKYGPVRASFDVPTLGVISVLTILAGRGTRTLMFTGSF